MPSFRATRAIAVAGNFKNKSDVHSVPHSEERGCRQLSDPFPTYTPSSLSPSHMNGPDSHVSSLALKVSTIRSTRSIVWFRVTNDVVKIRDLTYMNTAGTDLCFGGKHRSGNMSCDFLACFPQKHLISHKTCFLDMCFPWKHITMPAVEVVVFGCHRFTPINVKVATDRKA